MSDTQEYSIKPFDANLINPREDNLIQSVVLKL